MKRGDPNTHFCPVCRKWVGQCPLAPQHFHSPHGIVHLEGESHWTVECPECGVLFDSKQSKKLAESHPE